MPRSNPSNSYISSSGPVYTPQVSPSERDDDTSSVVSHRDYDHDYEARRFDQAPRDRLAGSDSGDAYTRRDLTPQKLVDREDDLRHEHRHHDRDVDRDRPEERGLFRSREDRRRDEGRYDLATRP
ncbi:MAG: hypothetical protein JF615_10920, partial [Asticcacaulis sp.]|nr:hypothetical protein [Asticcacaulis sp.]